MKQALRASWAIISHDLRGELRRPVVLTGMLLLGVGSIVALRFAMGGAARPAPELLAGALWIVVLYGTLLGTGRVLTVEREHGMWDALIAAGCDRAAIFLGKAGSACALTVVVHLLIVPAFFVLLGAPPVTAGGVGLLVVSILIADVGFAIIGVLTAAVGIRASNRDLAGAAMFVPLVLPLVVCGTELALAAWGAAPDASRGTLLAVIAAFDGAFLAAGVALVPELLVE